MPVAGVGQAAVWAASLTPAPSARLIPRNPASGRAPRPARAASFAPRAALL